MGADETYDRLLDDLGEALADSPHGKAEFGRLMGWKGDAMPRLVTQGQKGLTLELAARWARLCGRRLELVTDGDPVDRVVRAIRADTGLHPRNRRALEASYLAARRQFAEDVPPRQRRRASGE